VTTARVTAPAPRHSAEFPARPRLTVVRPRVVPPAKTPFALLLVGLLTSGLAALLLLNTTLNQNSFTVRTLRVTSARLAEQQQALERDVAVEATPRRLAERSRQLGMAPNDNLAFLDLATGAVRSAGEPR